MSNSRRSRIGSGRGTWEFLDSKLLKQPSPPLNLEILRQQLHYDSHTFLFLSWACLDLISIHSFLVGTAQHTPLWHQQSTSHLGRGLQKPSCRLKGTRRSMRSRKLLVHSRQANSKTWRLPLSITMSLTTLSGITAKGARATLLPFNICRLYHQRLKSS